jgi:alkylation response protein AidB-like acyl-CoA dehydrogenase
VKRTLFEHEHDAFRDSVRTFVAREVEPNRDRWRREHGIDRALWLAAGRQDFLGIAVAAEHGGAGIDDYRYNAVLSEELAAAGLAVASSVGIHVDVVAPYLTELATAEQQQRWLPRFCSGELVTAIGMTEPGAGSDLKALRTTARRAGGDWVIDGSKTFITNGAGADLAIVAARTGDRAEITLFGLEADLPGFTRGRPLEKIGQHEADTAELFFDAVRVTDDAVIGEVGGGFAAMMERLPQERLHTACVNVAHAAAALDRTLAYAREREAFGRPIGSFQHNRFLLAELVTEVEVTQVYVDRCIEARVAGELSAIDAAKAKWWSAEVQNRVIDACVQLYGGYGYMDEYEVARAWTDARVTKIWAGTNEIMKELIGRSLGFGEVTRP